MITARYHREIPQRYRLEAGKCEKCGHVAFQPRLVCTECKGKKFAPVVLSDEGKLTTFTVVRVASDKFSKETPFAVGIVELNDGVKVTAQIADADPEELQIGQKVNLVFRRIQEDGKAGILCYGYKA
ncbi:MAG: Zn-ribbon domain-containing OB-fold protein, partial [Bacteroidota bacterium]